MPPERFSRIIANGAGGRPSFTVTTKRLDLRYGGTIDWRHAGRRHGSCLVVSVTQRRHRHHNAITLLMAGAVQLHDGASVPRLRTHHQLAQAILPRRHAYSFVLRAMSLSLARQQVRDRARPAGSRSRSSAPATPIRRAWRKPHRSRDDCDWQRAVALDACTHRDYLQDGAGGVWSNQVAASNRKAAHAARVEWRWRLDLLCPSLPAAQVQLAHLPNGRRAPRHRPGDGDVLIAGGS
jgi:hypothetical protein